MGELAENLPHLGPINPIALRDSKEEAKEAGEQSIFNFDPEREAATQLEREGNLANLVTSVRAVIEPYRAALAIKAQDAVLERKVRREGIFGGNFKTTWEVSEPPFRAVSTLKFKKGKKEGIQPREYTMNKYYEALRSPTAAYLELIWDEKGQEILRLDLRPTMEPGEGGGLTYRQKIPYGQDRVRRWLGDNSLTRFIQQAETDERTNRSMFPYIYLPIIEINLTDPAINYFDGLDQLTMKYNPDINRFYLSSDPSKGHSHLALATVDFPKIVKEILGLIPAKNI